MSIQFRNSESTIISNNDSPELVEVATQIKAIRDRANQSSREHSRALDAINNDPGLSDLGKKERIDELDQARRAQRHTWMEQEKEIVTNKITALERRLDGFVGYSESNIIAFRDAQDRADAIKDAEKAAKVMERALRTNDRTLSHAVYRKAVENGWADARRAFAKENPAVASLVNDVDRLTRLRDESFNRAVAYM